jgi:hypothetical protein
MNKHFFAVVVLAAALVAGCGGGGGPTITYAVPTVAPMEDVKFSIAAPSANAARHRDYISASTESVTIELVTVPPATPAPLLVIDVTSGSANCATTSSGLTCTGSMSVPAGQQQFIVSTYDRTGGAGQQLSTGSITVLVSASSSNGLNLSNSVSLTLNSIVASIALAVSPDSLNVGADRPLSIALTAYDATGAIIVGPGSFAQGPILVDVPDPDPYFPTLRGPLVASFVGPGPAQSITYDAAAYYTYPQGGPLAFTASGVDVSPAIATVNFLPAPSPSGVATPTPGPTLTPVPTQSTAPTPSPTPTPIPQFTVAPDTITFAGVAPQATQTFTASETGVTAFTAVSQDTSIATVSGNGGSVFTVTAGSTPGQTGIIVSDPSHHTATVTVTVSGQVIVISTKGRPHS